MTLLFGASLALGRALELLLSQTTELVNDALFITHHNLIEKLISVSPCFTFAQLFKKHHLQFISSFTLSYLPNWSWNKLKLLGFSWRPQKTVPHRCFIGFTLNKRTWHFKTTIFLFAVDSWGTHLSSFFTFPSFQIFQILSNSQIWSIYFKCWKIVGWWRLSLWTVSHVVVRGSASMIISVGHYQLPVASHCTLHLQVFIHQLDWCLDSGWD